MWAPGWGMPRCLAAPRRRRGDQPGPGILPVWAAAKQVGALTGHRQRGEVRLHWYKQPRGPSALELLFKISPPRSLDLADVAFYEATAERAHDPRLRLVLPRLRALQPDAHRLEVHAHGPRRRALLRADRRGGRRRGAGGRRGRGGEPPLET